MYAIRSYYAIIVIPSALGMFIGKNIGSKMLYKAKSKKIRRISMKLVSKIALGSCAIAVLFLAGCNDTATPAKQATAKPSISEESLGLRKVDLYTEVKAVPEKTEYSKNYAGSGKTIDRAFQDAPPMIPHDIV